MKLRSGAATWAVATPRTIMKNTIVRPRMGARFRTCPMPGRTMAVARTSRGWIGLMMLQPFQVVGLAVGGWLRQHPAGHSPAPRRHPSAPAPDQGRAVPLESGQGAASDTDPAPPGPPDRQGAHPWALRAVPLP